MGEDGSGAKAAVQPDKALSKDTILKLEGDNGEVEDYIINNAFYLAESEGRDLNTNYEWMLTMKSSDLGQQPINFNLIYNIPNDKVNIEKIEPMTGESTSYEIVRDINPEWKSKVKG